MQPDWYETFFTALPNEFWRRAAPDPQDDIAFLTARLDVPRGARVVDVPCGSGRHSLALAALGYRVTGYDISQEAIDHARRRAAEAGLDATFRRAEMRDLPPSRDADLALCLGNSLGYLPEPGLHDFLAAIAGTLRPGGGLGLDFNATAESVLPGLSGETRAMHAGDISVEASAQYDVLGSRLLSHYRFQQRDAVVEATALHHVYTCAHLIALLEAAGFADVRCYDGLSGEQFRLGAGRLVVTAVRS
jgi:SAM-dependent methyltransferase